MLHGASDLQGPTEDLASHYGMVSLGKYMFLVSNNSFIKEGF